MALTASTVFDLVGQTQVLNYLTPSALETISFGNNQITYGATSGFNLSKSDLQLYFTFLNTYNNLLLVNFPTINLVINSDWPLSSFSISETNVGVLKIIYNQTSLSNTVFGITYLPIAASAAFVARPSPVTISLQEFSMTVLILRQYFNQISVN